MGGHSVTEMAIKSIAVEMNAISKRFGGVHALREVSLSVCNGEIHALLGENGAGKSTILKILRGVQAPDGGTITIGGEAFDRLSPQLARQKGVGMIFQEMSLVPTLSVAQNVFLASEPMTSTGLIDDRAMEQRSAAIFASMGVSVDPTAMVADLSTGQQQLTEIAKALSQNAEVLVLDEPTSALTSGEVDILFDLLRRLRSEGKAIIYVSHRMDEIFRIADHATVLRDGRLIDSRPIADYTLATLIADIMGKETRDLSEFATESTVQDDIILKVEHLSSKLRRDGDVSFLLRRGEVLGIAGLLGAGRSRLARMLFGLEPIASGTITLRGETISIGSARQATELGLALVPEDRRRQGLVLAHSIQDNIELPILKRLGSTPFVDRMKSRSTTDELIKRLAIKTASREAPANSLSGGNQQKIVIGKWLATDPDILIMDEPTAGIDIGSKGEVLRLVRALAAEGKSIIFISSELAELAAVSDRIAVMSGGRLVETIDKADLLTTTGDAAELRAEQKLQLIVQRGGNHV
ncbi:ribose transport system ATP-binding protein [Devosia subaequoris]|uniref:Ribose transport system ATP-binding protein n=1 Tax=Devosia subaequoris TaxID=395930 RepID=A0A7W6IR44_9HYPH|nr:ribose transport system ATP-binding protein [Devosia subaequoris]